MHKVILIDDIENADNKTLYCVFNEKIDEIDCITPIEAKLCAKSLGEFIQITGQVKGFKFDIDELYSKKSLVGDYENSDKEFEIKEGQFITDLNGQEEIDIYDLLYQSVILNFPNKKVCGINCKGKEYLSSEDNYDPRLEVFNNLQINPK